MKKFRIIICMLLLALSQFAGIAQGNQQKIEMKLDSIGNANLNISMTMDAQSWQTWLANIGNNPAIVKKEIERSMPNYFLDDFKLEKDEMNRSFTLSLKAYGICEIDKRGNWTLDTDQKNAQLTELTSHKYMLMSNPADLGGEVQQTYLIEFPEEAENIKIDKDSFGNTEFEFKMKNSSSGMNMMQLGGIGLLLISLILGGVIMFKK